MAVWSAGYVLDIEYTSGFYREISPPHIGWALHSSGVHAPAFKEGATYCELGCGQGLGTALLAAANPQAQFFGFDFNPAQIANARRLSAQAGLSNVTFEDKSFEEVATAPEGRYPAFDIIAIHGIYSWISEANRRFIVDILFRYLKPGGAVYVSYNCMPGWADAAPLQRLMREHANRAPDRSDLQAQNALAFANQLKDGGARYFQAYPTLKNRLEKLPSLNKNYVAHEYLNGYWHPLHHLDVVREMEPARLNYVCSATLTENMDAISLTPELQKLVNTTRDRGWAETIRDYAANKQFRRDIYMRGASQLSARAQMKTLADVKIAALVPRASFSFKFAGPLGEVEGQPDLYGPLADALCQRPHSVREIAALPPFAGKPLAMALQAISLLMAGGHAHPMISDGKGKAGDAARKLNKVITEKLRDGEILNFVAAPAIGSALPVSFPELVVLHGLQQNENASAAQLTELGLVVMQETGQRMLKDGKVLEQVEDNREEFAGHVERTLAGKKPIWKLLGVY
jgi:trans-aconitate methyltransferase